MLAYIQIVSGNPGRSSITQDTVNQVRDKLLRTTQKLRKVRASRDL